MASFQAAMVYRNLRLFETPGHPDHNRAFDEGLSVLVPARNEERNLPALLDSLSNQLDCKFEVIILDDLSDDGTYQIVESASLRDPRIRVFRSAPLPDGWAGKQYACHQLSELATFDHWLFLDADVVLTDPHALARIGNFIKESPAAMASSIPHQITGTWAEQMIIPLIHLVLLGFLPVLGDAPEQIARTRRGLRSDGGGETGTVCSLRRPPSRSSSPPRRYGPGGAPQKRGISDRPFRLHEPG